MKRIPKDPTTEIALNGLEVFKDDFITSRREDILKIRDSLMGDDFSVIKKFCHTWRGYAVPYGFGELLEFATELEDSSEARDKNLCVKILSELEAYLSSK